MVFLDELAEDESATEEETTHHIAIAALNEIDDAQTFVCLPTAEQKYEQADEVGR